MLLIRYCQLLGGEGCLFCEFCCPVYLGGDVGCGYQVFICVPCYFVTL